MSAAARAEARRKAILSRGSDRLSKLTTSARGDSPVYVHDDPPLPSVPRASSFVGEETSNMPAPSTRISPGPSPHANRTASLSHDSAPAGPDPSVWSEEQQQQLMQALLGSMSGISGLPGSNPAQQTINGSDTMNNPLAMLMNAQAQAGGRGGGAGLGKAPALDGDAAQSKPPSVLQKMLSLVHLVALWGLLAYFIIYVEPESQGAFAADGLAGWTGILTRWAELAKQRPQAEMIQSWSVASVPFFWAFITLEIALYSLRIFYGFDAVQAPMLIAMALPHLPPPFPSIIINGMKYLRLGSILLDDLAILAVGVGFFIWLAGLLRS